MASEFTLLMIKPDAVARGCVGQIIARLEAEGFRLAQMRLARLDRAQAESFYGVHRGKAFFADLVQFVVSGPVVPMVLEREDAVAGLRRLIGPTDSREAAPGTIRGDFGTDQQRNAVHASDSPASARAEIAFFFGTARG